MEGSIPLTDNMKDEIRRAVEIEGSGNQLARKLGYVKNAKGVNYLIKDAKTIKKKKYEIIKGVINNDGN